MRIFISYSRKQRNAVDVLANDLEKLGYEVWYDHELAGGQPWWDEILGQIRRCDVFVFALSRDSIDSHACRREGRYARDLGKHLIPVLTATVSTKILPEYLAQAHHVDYLKQDKDALLSLTKAMASAPAAGPLPDPLPDAPEVPISYLVEIKDRIASAKDISPGEQARIAMELKRKLRGPDAADVRALLKQLRERKELLASVAEEIDSALKPKTKPSKKKQPVAVEAKKDGTAWGWIVFIIIIIMAASGSL